MHQVYPARYFMRLSHCYNNARSIVRVIFRRNLLTRIAYSLFAFLFQLLPMPDATAQAEPLFSGNVGKRAEALTTWSERLEKEYPDIGQVGSIAHLVQPKLVNLLADKYFVPVFGKPFDQLSEEQRNKIDQQIDQCFKHTRYRDRFTWHWVLQEPFQSNSNHLIYANLLQSFKIQKSVREEYETAVLQLSQPGNMVSVQQLNSYIIKLQKDFSSLFPSEIKILEDLILQKSGSASDRELVRLLQQELDKPNNLSTIASIKNFPDRNQSFYRQASTGTVTEVKAELEKKSTQAFSELMQAERKSIDNFPSTPEGMAAAATWHQTFIQQYDAYKDNKSVTETLDYFEKKNLSFLVTSAPAIESLIRQAQSGSDLREIRNQYLRPLPKNNSVVKELSATLRKKDIQLFLEKRKNTIVTVDEKVKQENIRHQKRLADANKLPSLKFDGLAANYSKGWLEQLYKGDFVELAYYNDHVSYSMLYKFFVSLVVAYSDFSRLNMVSPVVIDYYNSKLTNVTKEPGVFFKTIVTNEYTYYATKQVHMDGKFYDMYIHSFGEFRPAYVKGEALTMEASLTSRLDNDAYGNFKQLILSNDKSHPGLKMIVENLHYFLTEGDWDSETANGYKFHEVHRDKKAARYYFKVRENFVPDYTPLQSLNNDWSFHTYIDHKLPNSLGLTDIVIEPFKTLVARASMFRDLLNQAPENIKNELIKGSYQLITFSYKTVQFGTIHKESERYWYSKGEIPSQAVQDYFKQHIERPSDKCVCE